MGWDGALIFGALKITIANHCDAIVWADLTALNFLITYNFCAVVWALDHSGMRVIDSHSFVAISYQSHFMLNLPKTYNST